MVPDEGLEPPTFGLQNRCTTTVLIRQTNRGREYTQGERQITYQRANKSPARLTLNGLLAGNPLGFASPEKRRGDSLDGFITEVELGRDKMLVDGLISWHHNGPVALFLNFSKTPIHRVLRAKDAQRNSVLNAGSSN